jgi:hypothetical protein
MDAHWASLHSQVEDASRQALGELAEPLTPVTGGVR